MTRITGSVKVEAPKNHLWDVVNDFPNIYKASSGVMASHSTSDQVTGVGATRHCDFPHGAQVEERIVDWVDGECMKIDIYETKRMPMLRNMGADFEVRGDEEESELVASTSFDVSGGRLGAMAHSALMQSQMTKMWVALLASFKLRAETGVDIGKDAELDTASVMVRVT